MSVTVEKLEKNMAKLTIEVSAEDMAAAEKAAYNKEKSRIALPGFRKGKAPYDMVLKLYGQDAFLEPAVNEVLPDAYENACRESGLDIVSKPVLDYTQVEHGKSLIVVATVAVKPEVVLGQYKGLEVEEESAEVTEEDILKELKNEQEKNAVENEVEDRPVQEGDTVKLDYSGSVDGVKFEGGTAENQSLVIGSHSFIAGFEEQMVGMNIGEEKDLNVTFPEEYHAEELAGKPAVFHVKVNGITEKVLPELDDEFASEVSEFATLEEYKASVKEKLAKTKAEAAKAAKEDALLAKAVENASMEIPDAMIESQAEDMVKEFGQKLEMQGLKLEQYLQYTGMNMAQIVDQYKDNAKKRIQGRLVLEAVAKAEGLEATDADVEAEMQKMAEQYSMELDQVKAFFNEDNIKGMKDDLATGKALDLIYNEAK